MKYGLTTDQYKFLRTNLVDPIVNAGGTVWLYGSRARGDHKPFSDVDVMVEADQDLSSLISLVQECLQKSNFPYKVDIVLFSQFAESYKPGYLKDRVPLT